MSQWWELYPEIPIQSKHSIISRQSQYGLTSYADQPSLMHQNLLPLWMQISTSSLGRPATVHSDACVSLLCYPFDLQSCGHDCLYCTYVLTHFWLTFRSSLVRSRLTQLWLLPSSLLSLSPLSQFPIVLRSYCAMSLATVSIVCLVRIGTVPPVYKPAIVLQSSLKLDLVFNPNVLKLHPSPCLPISLSLFSWVLLVRTLLHRSLASKVTLCMSHP